MVFRRSQRLRPIKSRKHIVDLQGGVPGNAAERRVIVKVTDNADSTEPTQVESGSKVTSLFLNIQAITTADTSLNNLYFYIFKNPQGSIPLADQVPANATGTTGFKRQIFHTEMAMMSATNDSIPITLFKGVLKIPRVFQTMRLDDEIGINLFSPGAGNTHDYCIEAIFKSYQ